MYSLHLKWQLDMCLDLDIIIARMKITIRRIAMNGPINDCIMNLSSFFIPHWNVKIRQLRGL